MVDDRERGLSRHYGHRERTILHSEQLFVAQRIGQLLVPVLVGVANARKLLPSW